jgi:hypothetical protein
MFVNIEFPYGVWEMFSQIPRAPRQKHGMTVKMNSQSEVGDRMLCIGEYRHRRLGHSYSGNKFVMLILPRLGSGFKDDTIRNIKKKEKGRGMSWVGFGSRSGKRSQKFTCQVAFSPAVRFGSSTDFGRAN